MDIWILTFNYTFGAAASLTGSGTADREGVSHVTGSALFVTAASAMIPCLTLCKAISAASTPAMARDNGEELIIDVLNNQTWLK